MSTSHSICSSSSLLMFVMPARPTTDPVCFLCASAASQETPSSQVTPPDESLTAITFAPASVNSRAAMRSEEHTSELQSLAYLVCRLLLEKKNQHKADDISPHL